MKERSFACLFIIHPSLTHSLPPSYSPSLHSSTIHSHTPIIHSSNHSSFQLFIQILQALRVLSLWYQENIVHFWHSVSFFSVFFSFSTSALTSVWVWVFERVPVETIPSWAALVRCESEGPARELVTTAYSDTGWRQDFSHPIELGESVQTRQRGWGMEMSFYVRSWSTLSRWEPEILF